MLNKLREIFEPVFLSIAKPFIKANLNPSALTASSVLLAFLSFLLLSLSNRQPIIIISALILFSLSSLFDALDGAVARALNKVSNRGAFLDSFSDRVNEILILTGVLLSGIAEDIWCFLFLVTSLFISYCRARGESLGINVSGVGVMERAERALFIAVGLILWLINENLLNYVLILGFLLNTITVFQRFIYLISKLD